MFRRALLAASLLTTSLSITAPALAQSTGPVPVGAVEILSGPSAAYGTAIRAGLELALDEVNEKGVLGGRKVALTVEDSAGNKDQAINAARKLVGRDHVVTVIGPTAWSSSDLARPSQNRLVDQAAFSTVLALRASGVFAEPIAPGTGTS